MKLNAIGFNITLPWNDKNSNNQNALGVSYNANLNKDTKEDNSNSNNVNINLAKTNSLNNDNKNDSNSSSSVNAKSDTTENLISKLDDIIASLKAKITKCNSSNDLSEEAKAATIDCIKSQIENLEKQKQEVIIQQQQQELLEKEKAKEEAEETKEKLDNNIDKPEDNKDNTENNISSKCWDSDFDSIISAYNSTTVIHGLKDIKNREKIEKLYLRKDNIENTYTEKRLKQINKSASTIEINIHNSLKDAAQLRTDDNSSKDDNDDTISKDKKDNSVYINKYTKSEEDNKEDALNILI